MDTESVISYNNNNNQGENSDDFKVQNANQTTYAYITKLRAISCIAVVILHTALAGSASFDITDSQRMWTMIIRNMMLWSVPCFIMVTGALLLNPEKDITYKKLFSKYIKRVVICILVFTAVFELFDVVLNGKQAVLWIVSEYAYKVVAGKSWAHMWYLYMLLGIYLLLPFYKMITRQIKKHDAVYLCIIYFLFLSFLPIIRDITGCEIAFFICTSTIYPFYLFIGYFIHSKTIIPRKTWMCILLALTSAGLIGLTAYAYMHNVDKLKGMLGTYAFPITVIQSVCVFSLFTMRESNSAINNLWVIIDKYSFGIYLIHMLILKTLFVALKFNPYQWGSVIMLIPVAICVFVVSLIVVAIFYKLISFVNQKK